MGSREVWVVGDIKIGSMMIDECYIAIPLFRVCDPIWLGYQHKTHQPIQPKTTDSICVSLSVTSVPPRFTPVTVSFIMGYFCPGHAHHV